MLLKIGLLVLLLLELYMCTTVAIQAIFTRELLGAEILLVPVPVATILGLSLVDLATVEQHAQRRLDSLDRRRLLAGGGAGRARGSHREWLTGQ